MTASLEQLETRRNIVLYTRGFGPFKPKYSKSIRKFNGAETSILSVKEVPVFRSGTFRDSMGEERTWDQMHLSQMQANYNLLKDNNVFPDVPVRKGHGSFLGDPMDNLVGYHTALNTTKATSPTDNNEYTYLLADYELYDQDAQANDQSGFWRNRSSEIGYYLTNDNSEYWPTYQGFAFVDIPAVEGLNLNSAFAKHFEQEKPNRLFSIYIDGDTHKEKTVADKTPEEIAADLKKAEDAAFEKGKAEAAAEFAKNNPGTPTAVAGDYSFKINGETTKDYGKVQSYLAGLETENAEVKSSFEKFKGETVDSGRKAYVTSLATDNKILATEVDDLTELALSYSEDQFAKFKKMYDARSANPMFSRQNDSAGTPTNGPTGDKSTEQKEFEDCADRIKWHKNAGRDNATIKATDSYKRYVELGTKLGHKLDLEIRS